jgi:lysozyme
MLGLARSKIAQKSSKTRKSTYVSDLINRLLRRDEGYRRSAYPDSLGFLTIGVGRCIDGRKSAGIDEEEAEFLLNRDISHVETALSANLPWFGALSDVRKAVLVSMGFQLGVSGLLLFRNTLRAIEEGRYADAATSMLASKWAKQVPLRASRLAHAMLTDDQAAFRLDEDA